MRSFRVRFLLLPAITSLHACSPTNELGHLSAEPIEPIPEVERIRYDRHLERECGADRVTATGTRLLTRLPYVQKARHDSAELMWAALGESAGTVELTTPSTNGTRSVVARLDDAQPVRGRQFVAVLGELEAATTYCYRVRGSDGAIWADAAFTTAPPPGAEVPISFAVLGDLGKRSSDQFAVLAQLEDVRSDFVLLAGDIAYDSGRRSELETNVFDVYREMMAQVPFFPASGNHDYGTDDAAPFREAFGLFENGGPEGIERWYSFDWGPVHVAVLDTEKIGAAQLAWLERDLTDAGDLVRIVLMHRPPYSSGSHGSDERSREALVPIFAKHSVPLVLAGHDHDYERTHPIDGVVYVVSGGGGRGTRPVGESDFTAYSAQVAHFVQVTVDVSSISATAIDATGEPFDAFTIVRAHANAPVRVDDRSR